MVRRVLLPNALGGLLAVAVGCSSASGPSEDWLVEASAAREGWLFMDGNAPTDDELFQLAVSASAIPAGDYDAAVELVVALRLEDDSDTGGAGEGDVVVTLYRGGELIATGSSHGVVGALEDVTLLDEEGIQSCGEGNACVFDYTIEATLGGEDLVGIGDVSLRAWIDGSGAAPADAQLTFALF